jgi:hypothetical protein
MGGMGRKALEGKGKVLGGMSVRKKLYSKMLSILEYHLLNEKIFV